MINKSFAAFILTHGRPDRVYTINALKNAGYTGEIYLVCDDEDTTVDEYKERHGDDKVFVFSKEEWFTKSDTVDADTMPRSVILPARNFCFELARKLKKDYFWELDDDYAYFSVKGIRNGVLHDYREMDSLDDICESYVDFLESNESIMAVCFAQNGDYIGGKDGTMFHQKIKFKAMNSFFCKTSRPFMFSGRINEDVTTVVTMERMGKLFMTLGDMTLSQKETQSNAGGMTTCYLQVGTYRKSFYSVIACPSAVKIAAMGGGHSRIHHAVSWENVHPYILSERWKKGGLNGA